MLWGNVSVSTCQFPTFTPGDGSAVSGRQGVQLAGFRASRTRLPFSSPTPAPLQPLNYIQAALILTGIITPSQPDCNQARLRHQGTENKPNPEPVTASPTSEDACRGTQHALQASLVRPPQKDCQMSAVKAEALDSPILCETSASACPKPDGDGKEDSVSGGDLARSVNCKGMYLWR